MLNFWHDYLLLQIKIVHMRAMDLLLLPVLAEVQKTKLLLLFMLFVPRCVMLQAELQIMQQAMLRTEQLLVLRCVLLQTRLPIL